MKNTKTEKEDDKEYLKLVREMVEKLDYGQVSIIVQDGKVVQIEQSRKIRLR